MLFAVDIVLLDEIRESLTSKIEKKEKYWNFKKFKTNENEKRVHKM